MPKISDAKAAALIRRAQREEDRNRVKRLERIKRAIAGSKFYDYELADLETTVFAAYGRTKLG